MKQKLFSLIKITSTILITCALGLETWQIYLCLTDASLPDRLAPILWLFSIVLVVHVIEGFIAAWKANTYHKNYVIYGIYTFFVGFVGLLELQDLLSNRES